MMTNIRSSEQKPIRVMIVDDHKSIVWGLQRLIESSQPRMEVVAMATSCCEMLDSVVAANPDIILLDLDLNGESAIDAMADVARLSSAQILVLTGIRDPATQQAAIMHGARGVVGKDESADVLLLAIERVHAGEVWINRQMMGKVLSAISSGAINDRNRTPDAARIDSLTPREREIVRIVVKNRGAKSMEIAEAMHISEHTLRNHLTVIYDKLNLRNRLDLFAYAVEHRLAAD